MSNYFQTLAGAKERNASGSQKILDAGLSRPDNAGLQRTRPGSRP
jgi:hypothetical protein